MRESEFAERGRLIEQMLDKIYPLDDSMPRADREAIDTERQMLTMRAGWPSMPIEQLRLAAAGRQ